MQSIQQIFLAGCAEQWFKSLYSDSKHYRVDTNFKSKNSLQE